MSTSTIEKQVLKYMTDNSKEYETTFTAVSYTHLDVYKRQGLFTGLMVVCKNVNFANRGLRRYCKIFVTAS